MLKCIGNETAKMQCKTYLSYNQSAHRPLFLLVVGPTGVGKSEFLADLAKELLGPYTESDLFWMRDLSISLGKQHTIQVETPSTLKTIPLESGKQYENKGIREISSWLQQSSLSGKKVLLIENIQRMTNAAMNAFLKTCEEPLNGRFLLATAEHESVLLPTIVSRAIVVRFAPLSEGEMNEYLEQNFPPLNADEKKLIIDFSAGNPKLLEQVLHIKKDVPECYASRLQLTHMMEQQGQRHHKHRYFKILEENGLLDQVLSFLIKRYTDQGQFEAAQQWIQVKQLIQANVNEENALWYGILSDRI